MTNAEPIWTQPAVLEDWPTYTNTSPSLGYSLSIPLNYRVVPAPQTQLGTTLQDQFWGGQTGELLTVEFMPVATHDAELRNWVEALQGLMGFPCIALIQRAGYSPALLEWHLEEQSDLLKQRLGVDEVYLYQGLAQLFQESASSLARFYIVLARRDTRAWKVSLAFASACLPGMPEEIINDNDHVRAGATFGYLQFL